MAISTQARTAVGESTDAGDYKAAFHRDALTLIIDGYGKLPDGTNDYSNEDEPNITGELVRCANEHIDCLSSPEWTKFYDVTEENPEHAQERKGKQRKRVDIVCTLTGTKPRSRMKFEAKRLKNPGFPAGKYIGQDGLGEFISGNYAPELSVVGMLGYIQSHDSRHWAQELSNVLEREKTQVCLQKNTRWEEAGFINMDHCYKTRHNRPTVKRDLLVYHLLLDFVKTIRN